MAEEQTEKIRLRTERYAAVMSEAEKRAKARCAAKKGNVLITISDVFEALCIIHPESFSQILGRDVLLPEVSQITCPKTKATANYSSEVDRYLSPFGGIIDQMMSSDHSGDIPIDSLHIAGALSWDPIPEVKNILSVCGIPQDMVRSIVTKHIRHEVSLVEGPRRKKELASRLEKVRQIHQYLQARCFGQDAVVNSIIIQLSIVWGMPPASRGAKPLSFFFVGAPGTGKNHLTKALRHGWLAAYPRQWKVEL